MEEKSTRGGLCNRDCWKLECFGKVSLHNYFFLTLFFRCLLLAILCNCMKWTDAISQNHTEPFWLGKTSKIKSNL